MYDCPTIRMPPEKLQCPSRSSVVFLGKVEPPELSRKVGRFSGMLCDATEANMTMPYMSHAHLEIISRHLQQTGVETAELYPRCVQSYFVFVSPRSW